MHVHFIAVAGTGMGTVAGLFKAAGHEVSGSDVAFYPPMGPALQRWGIRTMEGFLPSNLEPKPDLVVVGNVCRRDNPEARAAIDSGMKVASMVDALTEHIMVDTSSLVVGGTHGKTTTSAMCAWLLQHAGNAPGFLIGGLPKNFEQSYQLPRSNDGNKALPIAPDRPTNDVQRAAPFVIEGDEYDTAFFEKTPKFWHYRPEVAIVTSIEHDHIDIYPDEASYLAAFSGFIERVPAGGLIVAYAGDAKVVRLVVEHANAPVAWYALQEDALNGQAPHWLAARVASNQDGQLFDLYAGGVAAGRGRLALSGKHNLRNAMAALGAVCQGYGVELTKAMTGLSQFAGVARRQDLLGEPAGVRIYDDFAHHPTAVRETLAGLRRRHPQGSLWAVYEPRTATACRGLHQAAYIEAFDTADRVLLPPLGRSNIPQPERLDLDALAAALSQRGIKTELAGSLDEIITLLKEETRSGDTVALLSNGAFGGIHTKLLEALSR